MLDPYEGHEMSKVTNGFCTWLKQVKNRRDKDWSVRDLLTFDSL